MADDIKPSHRGRLHKALGVPLGKKIPAEVLARAKEYAGPAVSREITYAQNVRK